MTDLGLYGLPAGAFDKQDDGDDLVFYAPPRLVTHLDAGATTALSTYYGRIVPQEAVVLDLMSSWVSHLPDDVWPTEMIGHGMNQVELEANPRLDRWFVTDLNRSAILPLETNLIDVAMCCVGVQYLQRPVEVFAEVLRSLRPGGHFVVSFSNRCFPMKAVRIWRSLDSAGHAKLVQFYMERSGFENVDTIVLADGQSSDPLVAVSGRKAEHSND